MALVVGIDLGTSSVRAMLLNTETNQTGVSGEDYDISFPRSGWAEQDPAEWYQKTCVALQKLLASAGAQPEAIQAVSFSGQMHGLVCLDDRGEPLRPAIIWPDQRSAAAVRKIYDTVGDSFVVSQTQNTIATGFLIASLYWLFENDPETYQRIKYVLLPKDYIKFRLSSRIVTDYSDAAGSAAFDNSNLRWAAGLLEALGMNAGIFPECLPSGTVIGTVTEKAAGETGLAQGPPVVNGGADQCMQAIGNGILSDGVFACNIGTGGQISTSAARPLYDSKLRVSAFAHVIPGKWNIMAAILNAGVSLKWLGKQILGTSDYQALDRGAAQIPPGCEGLLFLPYLGGERILKDPDARGVFFGLTGRHDKYALARAVMEGVVFALRMGLDIIVHDIGIPCKKIIAAGGGAAGVFWPQIQADILEQPLVRNLTTEQACLGAAIVAGVGVGLYPDLQTAAGELVRYDNRIFEPRKDFQNLYRDYYALFQELYERNQDLFKRITTMCKIGGKDNHGNAGIGN
jgi:xylulokinase